MNTTDYRQTTNDQRLTPKQSVALSPFTVRLLCLWSLAFCLLALSGVEGWAPTAYAANYDIKEMTPEAREALAGRQTRYAELQQAKKSGATSENSDGYVNCAQNESLCSAENHDRQTIYRTIAEQNELGGAGLSQIQRAFAETIRERDEH